jgi:hypothetical protein
MFGRSLFSQKNKKTGHDAKKDPNPKSSLPHSSADHASCGATFKTGQAAMPPPSMGIFAGMPTSH